LNIITYNIDELHSGRKIKDYLKNEEKLSSRFIREAAREERIKVNKKVIRLSYILKGGDIIEIELAREESQNIEAEEIKLNIVYEDADLLVLNKPPGIVVHPTKSYPKGTLANGVLYYFQTTGQNCIVRLVSRLDMNTSGLIIIAKNQYSHMSLARDMSKEEFKKFYKAVVHNKMPMLSGTIDEAIFRPEGDTIKRIVDEQGQRSITHYEVLEDFKAGQLLKLELETGRTHQIRVHLSYMGCPIYGDELYGKLEECHINRQALHAYKLVFPHPRDGKIIELEADMPEDMLKLIEDLR